MTALSATHVQYGLLFSSQSLPGIFLALIWGFAFIYVPHAPAAVLLCVSVTISSIFSALAISHTSYNFLLISRFIFGLSDGALTIVQGAILAATFPHRVGVAFGAMLFTSRLSSFAGLVLPVYISRALGLTGALWISVLISLPPVIFSTLYAVRVRHSAPSSHSQAQSTLQILGNVMTRPFALVVYIWTALASVTFTLLHFGPDALRGALSLSSERAALITAAVMAVAGIAAPGVGVLQDRIRHRAVALAFCALVLTTGIALLTIDIGGHGAMMTAIFALCCVGIAWAIAPVTLLGCVALVVEKQGMPVALGVYKAVEDVGLATLHATCGALRDWSGSYVSSFAVLAGVAGTAVGAAALLNAPLRVYEEEVRLEGQLKEAGEEAGLEATTLMTETEGE